MCKGPLSLFFGSVGYYAMKEKEGKTTRDDAY
jgi:hypothetical protein